MDCPPKTHSRWLTKRMFFSVLGFLTATGLLLAGKMTDVCWTYSLAIVIAGHHAEDVVRAMRGGDK